MVTILPEGSITTTHSAPVQRMFPLGCVTRLPFFCCRKRRNRERPLLPPSPSMGGKIERNILRHRCLHLVESVERNSKEVTLARKTAVSRRCCHSYLLERA